MAFGINRQAEEAASWLSSQDHLRELGHPGATASFLTWKPPDEFRSWCSTCRLCHLLCHKYEARKTRKACTKSGKCLYRYWLVAYATHIWSRSHWKKKNQTCPEWCPQKEKQQQKWAPLRCHLPHFRQVYLTQIISRAPAVRLFAPCSI